MKRCLALVLSVVLVLTMMLTFASCDSGRVDGYYVITNAEVDGKEYPAGDDLVKLQNKVPALDNFYVKFAGEGQGEICFNGNVYTITYDDKQITVGDAAFEYEYEYAVNEGADTVFEYTYENGNIILKDVLVQMDKETVASANLTLKYSADLDDNAAK